MSNEKSGAEVLAEKMAKTDEHIAATLEEVKSMGANLAKTGEVLTAVVSELKEKTETEEVKSLKSQVEAKSAEANNLQEQLKVLTAGHSEVFSGEEEVKSISEIAKAIKEKGKVDLKSEEFKSIRFSDPTSSGFYNRTIVAGEVDVNKQPVVTILGDIDVLPALDLIDGDIAYRGYDESLVDIFDSNEMDSATVSEAVKNSWLELKMRKCSAQMSISDMVVIGAMSGRRDSVATLGRNLSALDKRYDRKLAARVFQDIISDANASKIGKFSTTSNDAPANAEGREDLRNFPTNLKVNYLPTSVLYVSRAYINALFSKEASDGHLTVEQFITNSDGIRFFVTPEGNIPVRIFEHSQIGTYKSLADGTTDITADYVAGGENTGKILAIVGDLRQGYKLTPSTSQLVGYSDEFSKIISGQVPAGKIAFAAQGTVAREAMKVLYAK